LPKENRAQAALIGSIMGKGSPPKKAPRLTKKGKTLTLCSNLELAVGDDVIVDEDVDE
jgi:hypothetical protein